MKVQRLSTLFFFWLIAGITIATAQFEKNYIPRKTFDRNATELIEAIEAQRTKELALLPVEDRKKLEPYFKIKSKYLIYLVKSGFVIDDDSLSMVLDNVFTHLVEANAMVKKPGLLLIIKSPIANAACYGDGVFAISVGLLSRLQNESQLAFILAHELAHYQYDHVQKKTLQLIKTDYEKRVKTGFSKLWTSEEIEKNQIEDLKRLVYETKNYSREREFEADSIGFEYFTKAGFSQPEALRALDKLDSTVYPKYDIGVRVFLPLDDDEYHLQPYLLNDQLSIYSKDPIQASIFSKDSLSTHPEIINRKQKLSNRVEDIRPALGRSALFQNLQKVCDFEIVESSYFIGAADLTLFEALQLLSLYPQNNYLISTVGKILIQIYEQKDHTGTLTKIYIPRYTLEYDPTLHLVNNFLQNITSREAGEIAYHFLKKTKNFDPQNEEHYYLLWKISSLTMRNDEKKRVKSEYDRKFPKGIYSKLMRDGISYRDAMQKFNAHE